METDERIIEKKSKLENPSILNIKEFFRFLLKYKLMILGIMFLLISFELIKIFERFLFKIIIDKGTEFTNGNLTKDIITTVLIGVSSIFIIIIILQSIIKWFRIHLLNRLDSSVMKDIKTWYLNHLIDLPYEFHTSNKTGSTISKLNRGSTAAEMMIDGLIFNMIPMIVQSIAVIISVMLFDIYPAMIIIITVLIFIIYSLVLQKKLKERRTIANNFDDTEKAFISDVFTNVESIKYFGKEEDIKSKFENKTEDTRKSILNTWDLYRLLDAGQMIILGIGTFFVLLFPILRFLEGIDTIGTVVFIYTVYMALLPSLYGFVHGTREFYRALADFDALFKFGRIETEKDQKYAKKHKIISGAIEFKNVDFNFNNKKIINNMSFVINPDENIAIVGHSGSGKTTLIKLLYRFYEPLSGEIKIDDIDIKSFKKSELRRQLSIVPQDCVLFDDTIYNNILFSNPSAKKEEVFDSIRFAQLDPVIERLPLKENTIVGERGIKLSGGEKQRVSIARAILANKKILILDEATSSLDSKTESDIQKDLEKLMKGRTTIIIAHRLSTIMKADRIFVMDKGNIVQIGKHEDLITLEGPYKNLWNLQKGGYIK